MTDKSHITLTYLNVRQSISILLAKLVIVDLIVAVVVIFFFTLIGQSEFFISGISLSTDIFLLFFCLVIFFKVFVACYVILSWLNEYYEITPEFIIHKHGIIFRKTEHYRLSHVRAMSVNDSLLGELFNYATITLYDIRLVKYLDVYLVHNARRYAKIIKELRPQVEVKEDHVWLPLRHEDEIVPGEKS